MFRYRRGNRDYYYRTERHGSNVRKVYLGTGPVAEIAYALEMIRKEREEASKVARVRIEAVQQSVIALSSMTELLVRASLLLAGYYRHARVWRKRHVKDSLATRSQNRHSNDRKQSRQSA